MNALSDIRRIAKLAFCAYEMAKRSPHHAQKFEAYANMQRARASLMLAQNVAEEALQTLKIRSAEWIDIKRGRN